MDENQKQAYAVIESLRQFKSRIDSILEPLEASMRVGADEIEQLQAHLTSLKNEFNAAAMKSPSNRYERMFLIPAVKGAINNLKARVDSHPINSNWSSGLYGASIEIENMLRQLEEEFPAA